MKRIFLMISFIVGGSLLSLCLLLIGCRTQSYQLILTAIDSKNENYYSNYGYTLTDSITYDSLMVGIAMKVQVIDKMVYMNFGNDTYAFQFESSEIGNFAEKIKDINVITLNDYSVEFLAGSELSDSCEWLFYSLDDRFNSYNIIGEKALIISKLNSTFETNEVKNEVEISFRFNKQPDNIIASQRYAIAIETENGTIFRDTTAPITILP